MHNLSSITNEKLRKFKLFIFDLDGTLYDQTRLRRRITASLIRQLLTGSLNITDLKIISSFRKQREMHKGFTSSTLKTDQYLWPSKELTISVEEIESRINFLMYKIPLKYLFAVRYKNVEKMFFALKDLNKQIAIYSDYPIDEKLLALQLQADWHFCSTDDEIRQLKPSGKAIEVICEKTKFNKEETILIGDREDTDGESARQAGITFLKVDVLQARKGKFYKHMLQTITTKNGR